MPPCRKATNFYQEISREFFLFSVLENKKSAKEALESGLVSWRKLCKFEAYVSFFKVNEFQYRNRNRSCTREWNSASDWNKMKNYFIDKSVYEEKLKKTLL